MSCPSRWSRHEPELARPKRRLDVMYVEARKRLVEWLRRQLIGPAGEGSLRMSPLERYPTGVLHPVDPPEIPGIDPASEEEPTLLDDPEDGTVGDERGRRSDAGAAGAPATVRAAVVRRLLVLRSWGRASLRHGIRRRIPRYRNTRRAGTIPAYGIHPDRAPGNHCHLVGNLPRQRNGRDDLGRTRGDRDSRSASSGRLHSHRHPVQSGKVGSGRFWKRKNP